MSKRRMAIAWTILVVSIGAAYFGVSRVSRPERLPVRIATSENLWCTLSLVALERGLFALEGLDASPRFNVAGRQNMDALIGGSVDLANVVDVNLAYQAYVPNSDLYVVGSIVTSDDQEIVVSPSSQIRSIADLRGKRLAYSAGTSSEGYVGGFLSANNLTHDDVRLERLSPGMPIVEALAGGAVDAAVTWQPFVNTAKKRLGEGSTMRTSGGWYRGTMNVAVRKSWAASHPRELDKLRRAYARAEKFVRDSADATREILVRRTKLSPEEINEIWPRLTFAFVEDGAIVRSQLDSIVANVPRFEIEFRNKVPIPPATYFSISVP